MDDSVGQKCYYATAYERGLAAQYREQWQVPYADRAMLNRIVHETHDRPTKEPLPACPKDSWIAKKSWKK